MKRKKDVFKRLVTVVLHQYRGMRAVQDPANLLLHGLLNALNAPVYGSLSLRIIPTSSKTEPHDNCTRSSRVGVSDSRLVPTLSRRFYEPSSDIQPTEIECR